MTTNPLPSQQQQQLHQEPQQYPYFPPFSNYVIPTQSPTNPYRHPIVDCGLAKREISEKYFPSALLPRQGYKNNGMSNNGLSRSALARYYNSYQDPMTTLDEYYRQCLVFKSHYDHQQATEPLNNDNSINNNVNSNHSTQKINDQFQDPRTMSSHKDFGKNDNKNTELPHHVGIWQLRTTPVRIKPFSEAIYSEKLSKSQGLTLK